MSTKWRRFEVMLPRQFNDGRAVPVEWLAQAAREIGDHFGSVSYETLVIEGHWQHAGAVYRDNLARYLRRYARQEGKPRVDEGLQKAMERKPGAA